MRRGCCASVQLSRLESLVLELVFEKCIWQKLAPFVLQNEGRQTLVNFRATYLNMMH